jgi:hypothetical protein
MMKLMVLLILVGTNIAEAHRVGNGGDGVKQGNKIYLLDLVESGVETNPRFNAPQNGDDLFSKQLKSHLPFMSDEVSTLLSRKIFEISRIDPVLAWSILQGIGMYSWNLTSRLSDIPDEETNLAIDPANLVQIAIREGQRIQIYENGWAQLEDSNKPALIIHEVLYALSPLEKDGDGFRQRSLVARELVGLLFSQESGDTFKKKLLSLASENFSVLDHGSFGLLRGNSIFVGSSIALNSSTGFCGLGGRYIYNDNSYSASKEENYFSRNLAIPESLCTCGKLKGDGVALFQAAVSAVSLELTFKRFTDFYGRNRSYLRIEEVLDTQKIFTKQMRTSASNQTICEKQIASLLNGLPAEMVKKVPGLVMGRPHK